MLRVVEFAYRTDTGRQRNANEDAYFASAPLFAVADGMGGAQAGEVASRLAAESFEPVQRGEESPEAYLRAIARTANARIHRLAQADSSRSGMGTTLTAALVEDDEVSFAHVGDSRAYLFRDGELKLLTSDHSLVEELRRQGRLTDEQAEDHPQRSIITRALGPEREVEVDTMTHQARPGDVYLLCSDGLTTMIREDQIAATLADAESLDDAVSRLVGEANEAGGRDNITVVAFRLEEAETAAEVKDEPTLIGPAAEEAGLTAGALAAEAAGAEARQPVGRIERERAAHGGAATPPRAPRWPRRLATSLVGLAIVAVIVGGAVYGLHHVYFLGTDSGGRVALYRGVPYDLPLGVKLYSEVYAAPVQVAAIPAGRRDSAINHTWRSRADAVSLIDDLQRAAERPSLRKPKQGGKKRKTGQAGGGQQRSKKKSGSGAGVGGGGGP
jgi:PPM family protein phosphatase